MKIINSQYSNYNNRHYYPSFKSSARKYENSIVTLAGTNVFTITTLFRDDLNFFMLADLIINKFANKKKVNISCLAGSDGSEAYSLAIALMEKISRQEYEKYFPILSLDKDSVITDAAKKGRINLEASDWTLLSKAEMFKKQYFINSQDAVKIENDSIGNSISKSYEPIPELKSAVEFRQGDLVKEVMNLKDDGNSVVLCRNVLPYLHHSDVASVAYDINENLKQGSLFVIGVYDKQTKMRDHLKYYGFKEIRPNIFEHC